MGTNSAIIHFDGGTMGIQEVLQHFDLSGYVTKLSSQKQDKIRVETMKRKSSETRKKKRKSLRSKKKGFIDKKETENGDSYIPGGF